MGVQRDYVTPVSKLRDFIRDFKATNLLLEMDENSDSQLQIALEDSLDYINTAYPPVTKYTIITVTSWTAVRDRAVLNVLQSNIIKSARNIFSYTDTGGVNIREEDIYGRYINIYNVLFAKNETHIQRFKTSDNADSAYGGVESEYLYEYGNWY